MNSYELNIVLVSENDAISLFEEYGSIKEGSNDYLEEVIPRLFESSFKGDSKDFCIDLVKRDKNEISIYCYGTKYPSVEIIDLFADVNKYSNHGIKIKVYYDGDGPDDVFCIVNCEKCSLQKYNSYYRKNKIGYKPKSKKSSKKVEVKKEKTESEKVKENLKAQQDHELVNELSKGINDDKSAIIRLFIRGKKKRELIKDLFTPYQSKLNEADYEDYCRGFNSYLSHDDYVISWCRLERKGKHYYDWAKGPDELIRYLTNIFEQGNYLYLTFNLKEMPDNLFDPSKYRVNNGVAQFTDLEALTFIMAALDGVNKANIKFRPAGTSGKEYYAYYPDSGRESPGGYFEDVTEDSNWPTAWEC